MAAVPTDDLLAEFRRELETNGPGVLPHRNRVGKITGLFPQISPVFVSFYYTLNVKLC